MTQEERQPLFKDLCTRLLYSVMVHTNVPKIDLDTDELIECESDKTLDIGDIELFLNGCGEFKPYLRSISSMTEKEKEEFNNFSSIKYYEAGKDDFPWVVGNYKQIDWLLLSIVLIIDFLTIYL